MTKKWYLGVNCVTPGCDAFLVVMEDPAGGTRTIEVQGPGKVTITCDRCGTKHAYSTAEFTKQAVDE